MGNVGAFRRPRPAAQIEPRPSEPTPIVLSVEDRAAWRAAVERREDAMQEAELLVARAKVVAGEAVSAERAVCRTLADKYGFDPRVRWALHADGRLEPAQG